MIISGDDIRNQRQQAEEDASGFDRKGYEYYSCRAILALFLCAEQLYEIRANLETLVDRRGPSR